MRPRPKPSKTFPTLTRRRFLLGGGALLGGLVLAEATLRQPRAFRVERLTLPLAKLDADRCLRLVQLSDLHLHSHEGYYERVAHRVNELQPDIILLTGDYVEQSRNLKGVLAFLGLLRARAGIFAVQGNWEYYARLEGENLRRKLARVGVRLLINERHDLEIAGTALSVLGLDYPSCEDDLTQLMETVAPERVNVLLSHVPAFAHQLLDRRINLILAGHTHGGQIRLPLLPPLYLPRFSGPFVAGLYRVGLARIPLYVTRGLGTSVLPVRFLCPPEITLLQLVAKKADRPL
jgi:hypothetical protein